MIFAHGLVTGSYPADTTVTNRAEVSHLSSDIMPTVFDVANRTSVVSNVTRMFNGGPANYADIRGSNTFERSMTSASVGDLEGGATVLAII